MRHGPDLLREGPSLPCCGLATRAVLQMTTQTSTSIQLRNFSGEAWASAAGQKLLTSGRMNHRGCTPITGRPPTRPPSPGGWSRTRIGSSRYSQRAMWSGLEKMRKTGRGCVQVGAAKRKQRCDCSGTVFSNCNPNRRRFMRWHSHGCSGRHPHAQPHASTQGDNLWGAASAVIAKSRYVPPLGEIAGPTESITARAAMHRGTFCSLEIIGCGWHCWWPHITNPGVDSQDGE